MKRLAWVAAVCALAAGCGDGGQARGGLGGDGGGGGGGGGGGAVEPPVVSGAFTYYGTAQGLSATVWDVSADEAGNVYVAAGDAVLAKRRGELDFKRFEPAAAKLTANCDAAATTACPVVSVAGGAPGVAVVGFRGIGTDGDTDPDWQIDSGGADVLAFDGTTLTRTRHVHVAGPPQQFCMDYRVPTPEKPCSIGDQIWEKGRRKVRQVLRLAVNHQAGTLQHGDVWMAGTHGTFSLLVANPEARGWRDLTKDFPGTEDRRYVWEHDHPAIVDGKTGKSLTGESTAIAVDPTTGDPWAANEFRLASKRGYGAVKNGWNAPMWPYRGEWWDLPKMYLDVWPDAIPARLPEDYGQFDAFDPAWMDAVTSLSFCDDGTLWIASALHGLARRAPDGTFSFVGLPAGLGNNASAVACDPSDGSVWVGFGWGGFGRWNGSWSIVPEQPGAPFATRAPVRNIQIDRWATPRIVYVAHAAWRDGKGGLSVYAGP